MGCSVERYHLEHFHNLLYPILCHDTFLTVFNPEIQNSRLFTNPSYQVMEQSLIISNYRGLLSNTLDGGSPPQYPVIRYTNRTFGLEYRGDKRAFDEFKIRWIPPVPLVYPQPAGLFFLGVFADGKYGVWHRVQGG